MARWELLTVMLMLTMWFAGAALALSPAGVSALMVGDCRAALEDAEGPSSDAERLALARCHLQAEQHDRASAVLQPARDGQLRDYVALVEGEALLAAGRWADAAERLGGVSLPGQAGQRAAMLRGQALIESGDYLGGKAVLNGLLNSALNARGYAPSPLGADPAEVRWWLAQGAIRRGEPKAAVPVLAKIWTWNSTSPRAEEAAALLASMDSPVPATTLGDDRKRIRERIRTLRKLHLYKEALALQDLLPVDNTQAGVKSLASFCFKAKDYPRAVALYARIQAPTVEERFHHALGMSRTGDYEAAAALYLALMKAAPTSSRADLASYKLGYLRYDAGDLEPAVKLLRQHLVRYPKSKHADEARWFIAWSLYRLERLDEAHAEMATLLAAHGRSSLAPAARYWQARIAHQKGDQQTAEAGYRTVLKRWPVSGYAWFAAWRLGQTYAAPPPPPAPTMPSALVDDAWRRGTALASAGLGGWARQELGSLVKPAKAAGKDARLALAAALVDAGDYVTAQQLARSACGRPWSGSGDPTANALCTPRPVGDAAVARAKDGGLPANLPFGIMTAESALRPEVTSPAGARGLMQLMPSLAEELHAVEYPLSSYHPDLLYTPGYNAALGIAELTALHERFVDRTPGSALPLVIAGYNGGADAVERWLGAYASPPEPDRFAEDIGYTETRRYVRRVLGFMQTYRYVYGD